MLQNGNVILSCWDVPTGKQQFLSHLDSKQQYGSMKCEGNLFDSMRLHQESRLVSSSVPLELELLREKTHVNFRGLF